MVIKYASKTEKFAKFVYMFMLLNMSFAGFYEHITKN